MERGDGFWTSENKGWKTRRAEQDRYRRALDQQIEERKRMNPSRRSQRQSAGRPEPELPKIDPVQHLMPWLNNPSAAGSVTTQPQQGQGQLGQPQLPQVAHLPNQVPPNYYFVANQVPQPHQGPHPQPPNMLQPPGPFAYFGSSPLPPPAEFAPFVAPSAPSTTATATAHPAAYQQTAAYQQPAAGFHQPTIAPGYNHPTAAAAGLPQQYTHPPNPVPHPHLHDQLLETQEQDLQNNLPNHVNQTCEDGPTIQSQAEYRMDLAKQMDEKRRQVEERLKKEHEEDDKLERKIQQSQENLHPRQLTPEKDLNRRNSLKIHVHQTSDEIPTPNQAEYRMELAKQVEEKRRRDSARAKKEQEEEERLQRKIQQDQEKLRREHEEELKRAKEKEQEENRKRMEKLKSFEMTRTRLDAEAEMEKKRQQSIAERQQQLKDAAHNSRAALSTSPSRYYGRDEGRHAAAAAWESTVVPTRQANPANINIINHLEENDSGDLRSTSATSHPNGSGDLRSASAISHPPEGGDYYFDEAESTAASSSRTYLLSEDREDDRSSVGCGSVVGAGGPSGVSKSHEQVGGPCRDEDMMMCPRCARSFSSTDIQYPKSPTERMKFLNFLDNIHKRLQEEKARLIRNGFDWNKQ